MAGPAAGCVIAGLFAGVNMTEPDAGSDTNGADAGAVRAGPVVGSGAYCALAGVGRQNASASSVKNTLYKGIIDLAACVSTGSSAILGPFSFCRQIFKWRDKSYY
jgi:hypothetical protein